MNSFFINNIIYILGGLSLFLYALELLKTELKKNYTKNLYLKIQKATNNTLKAYLIGIISTIVIQSSSGITAITISLLATDYISLKQALGIVLGSNIGTCFSAFLIGLNIEKMALPLIGIFFFLYVITKSIKRKKIFIICINIGIIFLGLDYMGIGFSNIARNPQFSNILNHYSSSSLLSMLFGSFLTTIIQSSSATIGVVEQMYAAKIIPLASGVAIMLGSNIGTTVTGYFSTINTNYKTKQLVNANLYYNIIGALIFFIFLFPYTVILKEIENNYFYNNPKLTIALSHLFFNVSTALISFFLIDYLIALSSINFKKNICNT